TAGGPLPRGELHRLPRLGIPPARRVAEAPFAARHAAQSAIRTPPASPHRCTSGRGVLVFAEEDDDMEAQRTTRRWTYAEFARLPVEAGTRREVIAGEL